MRGNTALAVDIVTDQPGISPNDKGDMDDGPNGAVNFPVAVMTYKNPVNDGWPTEAKSGQWTVSGLMPGSTASNRTVDVYGMQAEDLAASDSPRLLAATLN